MRAASLFAVLMAFWLLLSGHYSFFLVSSGVICCLVVVFIAHHKGVFDIEGGNRIHPLLTGIITYWPWLCWQIFIANVDVFKRVWHPRLPINPRFIRVPFKTRTDLMTTLYANSITLTPGTVTVVVNQGEGDQEGEMLVHALSETAADGLLTGEMHDRVEKLEQHG